MSDIQWSQVATKVLEVATFGLVLIGAIGGILVRLDHLIRIWRRLRTNFAMRPRRRDR